MANQDHLLVGDAHTTQSQMFRYFWVGGIATVCDYGINIGLLTAGAHYASAVVGGFLIGVWVNYLLSVHWAFRGAKRGRGRREQFVFLITGLLGLGINVGIVALLVETGFMKMLFQSPGVEQLYAMAVAWHPEMDWPAAVARIPAILTAFAWNFYSRKWWVFG